MIARLRNIVAIVAALLSRPDLWRECAGVLWRMLPNDWIRRGPLPPIDYIDYRGQAVYGMPLIDIPKDEFIRYMEWCKAFPGPVR